MTDKLFYPFLILLLCTTVLFSCKKENMNDATTTAVRISVVNEKGEVQPACIVKLFDEASFLKFKEDVKTETPYKSTTDKSGIAYFTIDNAAWFSTSSTRELNFVVIETQTASQVSWSSAGGTVMRGKDTAFKIVVKNGQTIPDESTKSLIIEDGVVKGISDENVSKVIFPNNVKAISEFAFRDSKIVEVVLNEGIERIGRFAFMDSKIQKINFPSTLVSIEESAFQDCINLSEVDLSRTKIETIGVSAFIDCGISALSLPEGLKEIQDQAFYGNKSLKEVKLPLGIQVVENSAFCSSSIVKVELPNSVTRLGYRAFADCADLKDFIVYDATVDGNGETIVEIGCFENCTSLKEIKIPDSIKKLEGHTFIGCKSLERIILSKNLIEVGNYGIRTNYPVKSIEFTGKECPKFLTNQVLPFIVDIDYIVVPKGCKENYVKGIPESYKEKIKEKE